MRPSALLLLAALVVTDASAQPSHGASSNAACPQTNAIAAIACELGRGLGSAGGGALVVPAEPRSDRPMRDAPGLARRLASAVAGALGDGARAASGTATLPTARALARETGTLVYLEPVIDGGSLAVTAEVFAVKQGFWDRLRLPAPGPTARHFAARRIDAEVGHHLEIPPLVFEKTARVPWRDGTILALACGPVSGDGALELVAVTRHKVAVGRLGPAGFLPRREVRWNALAPVAPVPLREPIATAHVHAGGIIAGVSDRASAVVLTASLALDRRLPGQVPVDPLRCASVEALALGRAVPCGDTGRRPELPDGALDAAAWSAGVTASGAPRRAWAWRDPASRTVTLRSEAPPVTATLEGSGAQLALGDLDLDGHLELLSSRSTPERAEDALRVHTWTESGALELRLEVPVPGGIDALAVCPPERGRLAPTVIATGPELRVLR
jgi:hypothetical protein